MQSNFKYNHFQNNTVPNIVQNQELQLWNLVFYILKKNKKIWATTSTGSNDCLNKPFNENPPQLMSNYIENQFAQWLCQVLSEFIGLRPHLMFWGMNEEIPACKNLKPWRQEGVFLVMQKRGLTK